jgi:uncharacterized protein YndB with AHSA1/START domain
VSDVPGASRATTVTRHVRASPAEVYRALVDPAALVRWRAPDGMTAEIHELDARVGGTFRVSLTYKAPTDRGKTGSCTDTYHGSFDELVPGERVVERIEFETDAPELQGVMTLTTTLREADAGTDVEVCHEGLPPGVHPADNELGTAQSLAKLAHLVEQPGSPER